LLPLAGNPFGKTNNGWWESLALGRLEKMNLQSDLETLQFAGKQEAGLEEEMTGIVVENEEIGRLLHICGFGVITVVTVYAAIGDISLFEDAEHLVGYAGLGTRVHDSGLTMRTGKITKAGRRDLRVALVEAAHVAANSHPHWKAELACLQPRLGYNKTIVAIARMLLVTVWQSEKSSLLPLERRDFPACNNHLATVNPYSQVVFETNRYSVPSKYLGQQLPLECKKYFKKHSFVHVFSCKNTRSVPHTL
jgi:Transposase IS116/IS110/IS902 family